MFVQFDIKLTCDGNSKDEIVSTRFTLFVLIYFANRKLENASVRKDTFNEKGSLLTCFNIAVLDFFQKDTFSSIPFIPWITYHHKLPQDRE